MLFKRILSSIIDYAIMFFFIFLFGEFFGEEVNGDKIVLGLLAFVPILFWLILFPILEHRSNGQTLGHKLMKIKVLSVDGEKLTFKQVFKRRLMDSVEFMGTMGVLSIYLYYNTDKNQRLGDIVAKTKVVEV